MGLVSEDAVSDIIVMRHLNGIKKNDILKFGGIPHDAVLSYNDRSAYESAMSYFRILIDYEGTVKTGCGSYLGAFCNPDILSPFFKSVFRKAFSEFKYE